jgi:hypothetical protein
MYNLAEQITMTGKLLSSFSVFVRVALKHVIKSDGINQSTHFSSIINIFIFVGCSIFISSVGHIPTQHEKNKFNFTSPFS